MKKVCIIGSIGYGEKTSSGQIIRTRILQEAMVNCFGTDGVYMINTSDNTKHVLKILGKTIKSLFYCDVYIIILSGNGRKLFFPILRIFKKLFGKKVLNNIIGGDYASSVEKYPKYIGYSNSFDVNWVQTPSMKNEVEAVGIRKVEVLPNSKPLRIVDLSVSPTRNNEPYQFCTFSRVSKEKGIELAIKAIERVNNDTGKNFAVLTVFGNPDDNYKEQFDTLLKKSSNAIHYGGVIEYDKTTETLSKYYILLFPTTFYGEGFPGTILDAYASGLPVIASSWKFNSELVENGKTGFVYDFNKPELLTELIRHSVENASTIEAMRKACIEEAKKYVPENVMPIIVDKIKLVRGDIVK